ncbi:MAG: radical SAM family heme chaperone HemW [Pyrinomonadaceae bacterium]
MELPGIYIHIPFCRSRCSYCDFATDIYEGGMADRYVDALTSEIVRFERDDARSPVDTVYFGGGTPSMLSSDQLARILDAVLTRFHVVSGAEITMEMNPGTLTPEILSAFRAHGVNRASFGAQTFDDGELKRLGRRHTADDVRQTIDHLRLAGFDNVSFDLIAGLPAQILEAWERNMDQALALRPEHLSLYLLEVHEGTPLADQIRKGQQPIPDDDLAAEMYEMLVAKTAAAGYEHYEISNFALPGYASRHNSKYWTGAPVFGFGCSAHSYDGSRERWSNERDTARYVELIIANDTPVVETIVLNEQQVRAESIFLSLRMLRGVDLRIHQERFGVDLRTEYRDDLARLTEAGLIEFDHDLLRLTPHGALMSNEVFAAFV